MHHFAYRSGALHAEDVPLARIASEVGTPFYCYSSSTIERHFEVFRAADMPVVPICFGNGSPLRPEWSIGWRNGDVILFGERTLPPV